MTNQKILLATRAAESPPYEGGFVMLKDLAVELAKNGQDVTMFSSTTQPGGSFKKLKIFSQNGWGMLAKLQFFWGIYKQAENFDVVHLAHVPTPISAKLMKTVIKKSRKNGSKFVQTITGLSTTDPAVFPNLVWGDYVVCQTERIEKMVKENFAGKPTKLILPWPSPERVSLDEKRRENNRQKYLTTGKQKLVVFPGEFGRMGIGKDFENFIDNLISLDPAIAVVVACRFDEAGVGKYLAEKYPKDVISLGETPDILGLMEAADLVIFPTKKIADKFHPPLVLMEALQLGTPVLASQETGLNQPNIDILTTLPGDTGWRSFAEQAQKILATQQVRSKEKYAEYFSRMAADYQSVYLAVE